MYRQISTVVFVIYLLLSLNSCYRLSTEDTVVLKLEKHFHNLIEMRHHPDTQSIRKPMDYEYLQIYNTEKPGISFVLGKLRSGNKEEKNLAASIIMRIITAEEGWMEYQTEVSRNAHWIFGDECSKNIDTLIEALSIDDPYRLCYLTRTLSDLFRYDEKYSAEWEELRANSTYIWDLEGEPDDEAKKGMSEFIKQCKDWWKNKKK